MTVEDPFIQWGTVNVGLGHVQADREAADSRHERVCTYLVVPARGGDMSPPYRGFHGNNKMGDFFGMKKDA